MANLMHHRKPSHVNYMTNFGQKVKNLVELGAQIKGIYDTSKAVYAIGSAAAPYVLPLLGSL